MALSNSQYEQLMRTYELRQLDNEHKLYKRYETACARIPKLKELDDAISSLSVSQGRNLLEGDDSALPQLKEQLSLLFAEKKELIKSAGFPADYLELHYTCPDCRDTGYIGADKCHCLQKAIVDLLYTQSNLKEILAQENFSPSVPITIPAITSTRSPAGAPRSPCRRRSGSAVSLRIPFRRNLAISSYTATPVSEKLFSRTALQRN